MRRRILAAIVSLLPLALSAQGTLHIWKGTSCRKDVTMTCFLPEGEPKASVIICPGGSYYWRDKTGEGPVAARWLASEGYAAYVLNYRVAGVGDFVTGYRAVFRGNRHPDMICDLQRALQLIREGSDAPVGVMGFSAGGHLVLSSGAFYGTNFLSRYGISPEVSLRPDFIAAIYPVVTMSDANTVHRRSRRGLMGRSRVGNTVLRDSLSIEKHVSGALPPVFLLNCEDDPVVDGLNSAVLDSALTAEKVPHLYVRYLTGGHGFGADPDKMNEETSSWKTTFLQWLETVLKCD